MNYKWVCVSILSQCLFVVFLKLIGLHMCAALSGYGTYKLKFVKFMNINGELANGLLCDNSAYDKCDHVFKVCLTPYLAEDKECLITRQFEVDNTNQITFGDKIGYVANPIIENMEGDFYDVTYITIIIQDKDDNGIRQNVHKFSRILNLTEISRGKFYEFSEQSSDDRFVINYSFYGKCLESYFGPNCANFCRDKLGQYKCHINTGELICEQGWLGSQCNIPNVCNAMISNPCIHVPNSECHQLAPKYLPKCFCKSDYIPKISLDEKILIDCIAPSTSSAVTSTVAATSTNIAISSHTIMTIRSVSQTGIDTANEIITEHFQPPISKSLQDSSMPLLPLYIAMGFIVVLVMFILIFIIFYFKKRDSNKNIHNKPVFFTPASIPSDSTGLVSFTRNVNDPLPLHKTAISVDMSGRGNYGVEPNHSVGGMMPPGNNKQQYFVTAPPRGPTIPIKPNNCVSAGYFNPDQESVYEDADHVANIYEEHMGNPGLSNNNDQCFVNQVYDAKHITH